MLPKLLTPAEAADCLGVTVEWLRLSRYKKSGPPYCAVGHRTVRYLEADLRAWLESRRTEPSAGKSAVA